MTGYSFSNYTPPSGQWGNIVTADDMRYTYMFGIDAIAQDLNKTAWQDEQFDFYVDGALSEFEEFLTIDIRKKVYKTPQLDDPNSLARLNRGRRLGPGVDYTDVEDPYPYIPEHWTRHGHLQLRHYPIISVERAILNAPYGGPLLDLVANNWLQLSRKETGQLAFYPHGSARTHTSFAGGSVANVFHFGFRHPNGFEIDYTTGYENADFVPDSLREIVAKYAAIKALASIGDGLLAGFSSQSVSLDGLSESFSSTQSATSAYFGARIKQYQEEVSTWLQKNRYKFGAIPMGFAI